MSHVSHRKILLVGHTKAFSKFNLMAFCPTVPPVFSKLPDRKEKREMTDVINTNVKEREKPYIGGEFESKLVGLVGQNAVSLNLAML
jgi:hypothetical protein